MLTPPDVVVLIETREVGPDWPGLVTPEKARVTLVPDASDDEAPERETVTTLEEETPVTDPSEMPVGVMVSEPLSASVKLVGSVMTNLPVVGTALLSVKAVVTVTDVAPAT